MATPGSIPSPSRKGLSFPIQGRLWVSLKHSLLVQWSPIIFNVKDTALLFQIHQASVDRCRGHCLPQCEECPAYFKCIFLHTWGYTFIAVPFPMIVIILTQTLFILVFVLRIFSFQQNNSMALSFSLFTTAEHSLSISHQKYFIIPLMMEAECYHFFYYCKNTALHIFLHMASCTYWNWVPLKLCSPSLWLTSLFESIFPFLSWTCAPQDRGLLKKRELEPNTSLCVPVFK